MQFQFHLFKAVRTGIAFVPHSTARSKRYALPSLPFVCSHRLFCRERRGQNNEAYENAFGTTFRWLHAQSLTFTILGWHSKVNREPHRVLFKTISIELVQYHSEVYTVCKLIQVTFQHPKHKLSNHFFWIESSLFFCCLRQWE